MFVCTFVRPDVYPLFIPKGEDLTANPLNHNGK